MGQDFCCACRTSGGHWFLCHKHEQEMLDRLILYMEKEFCKHFNDNNDTCQLDSTLICEKACTHYQRRQKYE